MKRIDIILLSITTGLLCSCQGLFNSDQVGQAIRFSAAAHDFPSTKTYYSGKTVNVGGEEKEIIYWGSKDGVASDDVTVFMYWEQQGSSTAVADPNAAHSLDYSVVPTDKVINERHYGQLQSKGGGELTWKGDTEENVRYDHYFYSVYPAGSAGISYAGPNEVELEFNLPAGNANNMRCAYMAAAAQSVPTQENKDYKNTVDLDYYPMITTLSVTLINESDKSGNLGVSISASPDNTKNPLFGSYFVKQTVPGGKFVSADIQEGRPDYSENTSYTYSFSGKGSQNAVFFIRPRYYDGNDVILTVGEKTYPLAPKLMPCHKYNITVTVKGNEVITPPSIRDLSDAGAQAFGACLMQEGLGSNQGVWNILKDYYKKNRPDLYDEWGNTFNSKIWPQVNKLLDNLGNVTYQDWIDIFGEEAANIILDAIRNKTEFKLQQKDFSACPTAKDFQTLFANVETLHIQFPNNCNDDLEINGLEHLKSLTILHPPKSVSISNCETLTKLDLSNTENVFENFYMENCGLTSFSFGSANAPDAQFEFKNMPDLTTIYVEKAKKVKASYCPELKSITYNTNYGTTPTIDVDKPSCPNYK